MTALRLVRLEAEEMRDLRRRVLYRHAPEETGEYVQDDLPTAFHIGATTVEGQLVAVASWYAERTEHRPARRPYRLRGMAVDPLHERRGIGRLVFDAGVAELRGRRADLLWANARDAAVGFYEQLGMSVVGDGFLAAGGIPHHVVVLDLTPGDMPGHQTGPVR